MERNEQIAPVFFWKAAAVVEIKPKRGRMRLEVYEARRFKSAQVGSILIKISIVDVLSIA